MGEIIAGMLEWIMANVSKETRLTFVACSAFVGLVASVWIAPHYLARKDDLSTLKGDMQKAVQTAIAPIAQATAQNSADLTQFHHEWSDWRRNDLTDQILGLASKCKDAHTADARNDYKKSLTKALERYEDLTQRAFPESVDCQ